MSAQYKVLPSRNGQYYFTLQADNNEIILTSSETYVTKQGARDGIDAVKRSCSNDSNYERYTNSNGYFMFNLKAYNNKVLGISEQYTTAVGRENGIAAVKRVGPSAPIVDLA